MKFEQKVRDETERAARLLEAQAMAERLFAEAEQTLIRPGIRESVLNGEIYALAERKYGVRTHWHKRVVRAGANTLCLYDENPPDLMLQEDDILFLDLGPVFEEWEADVGRTYVLGSDPRKLQLQADLRTGFEAARRHFRVNPDITGHQLYRFAQDLAARAGWTFGGRIAGHLIGEFPHKQIPGDITHFYISEANPTRLRGQDPFGRERHWILEIHFVDKTLGIGGFLEELMTLP